MALSSLVWFVVAALPLLVGLAIARTATATAVVVGVAVVWGIVVTAPVTAGVFHLAGLIVKREMPAAGDLIAGIRQFAVGAWKLAVAQVLITLVAVADVVFFYLQFGHTGQFLFAMVGAVAVYVLAFWAMMMTYQWSLLVEQDPPTHKLIYRSFLFVADNLAFTTVVFLVIISLSILCLGPGVALLYMGAVAITSTGALRELFRKYGLAEVEPDVVEDKAWHIGDYR